MVEQTSALPEGYKTTELGPLPEEWEVVRLGKLSEEGKVNLRNGFAQGAFNQTGQGVPHLRPFNVTSNGDLDFSQIKYVDPPLAESIHWLRQGDVIFNNTNSEDLVGKTSYFGSNRQCVLSNHMTSLRVVGSEEIDAAWLAGQLHYLWEIGLFRAICRRHVNQASVSMARLKSVSLRLPPLPEQQAIAHVLNTVRRARETTEQVITSAHELKKSLMRHLFTYGPMPVEEVEQVPLKETTFGSVPEHWEIAKLGEVISVGPQNGIYKPQSAYGEGTPIVRIDDFGNEGGTITFTPNRLRLSPAEIEKYYLRPCDILVNRVNSLSHLGKSVLVGAFAQPTVFESNMMRFGVDAKSVAPEYLSRFLSSSTAREQMRGKAKRAVAQSSINQGDVKSIVFPLPPLSEQQEIARILRAVDEKIAAEENRKRTLEALFKTLLHHLMTGKLRVGVKASE